jgi:hypothetical protein
VPPALLILPKNTASGISSAIRKFLLHRIHTHTERCQPCRTRCVRFYFGLGPQSANVRHQKTLKPLREIPTPSSSMHTQHARWRSGRRGTPVLTLMLFFPKRPRGPEFKSGHLVVWYFQLGRYCSYYRDWLTPLQILKRLMPLIWWTFSSVTYHQLSIGRSQAKNYLSYGRTEKVFSHC